MVHWTMFRFCDFVHFKDTISNLLIIIFVWMIARCTGLWCSFIWPWPHFIVHSAMFSLSCFVCFLDTFSKGQLYVMYKRIVRCSKCLSGTVHLTLYSYVDNVDTKCKLCKNELFSFKKTLKTSAASHATWVQFWYCDKALSDK